MTIARPLLLAAAVLLFAAAAPAKPTQEQFLKSVSQTVDQQVDPGRVVSVLCAVVAVICLLVVIGRRQTRKAAPPALNHPGKLTREVLRKLPLKRAEVQRLKTVAGQKQLNPVVLLLCPSLLSRKAK